MDVVNSRRPGGRRDVTSGSRVAAAKEEHQPLHNVPDSAITQVCGCGFLWGVTTPEVIHWNMV